MLKIYKRSRTGNLYKKCHFDLTNKKVKFINKRNKFKYNFFKEFFKMQDVFQGGYLVNKYEFVTALSFKLGCTKKEADKYLKAFEEVIMEELKNGGKIQLIGFGSFEVIERPAREGRNPLTGDTLNIPAVKVARFKPGKALKDSINFKEDSDIESELS
jgi:DNA-binding protein HU-beta